MSVLRLVALAALVNVADGWLWVPPLWSSWSECSRTCGGGVRTRTRSCSFNSSVSGECSTEHRLCHEDTCPRGQPGFREMQCRRLDGTLGRRWIPAHAGNDPCALNCRSLDAPEGWVRSFGHTVDGTRCLGKPDGVCVGGKCLVLQCDGHLAISSSSISSSTKAICRQKMGHVRGQRMASDIAGYTDVLRIPSGATGIHVQENGSSYLALRDIRGRFLLNGHWVVALPGLFSGAATVFTYGRTSDTDETLDASGPTDAELRLMVLGNQGPSLSYAYWTDAAATDLAQSNTSKRTGKEDENDGWMPSSTVSTEITAKPRPVVNPPPHHFGSQSPKTKFSCRECCQKDDRFDRFCHSDFVIRALVERRQVFEGVYRLELRVLQSFKNTVPLQRREYVWSLGSCLCCWRLLPGRRYMLMGTAAQGPGHRETRLVLDENSFVALSTRKLGRYLAGLRARGSDSMCQDPKTKISR